MEVKTLGEKRKYEMTIKETLQWAKNYPKVKSWLSKIQREEKILEKNPFAEHAKSLVIVERDSLVAMATAGYVAEAADYTVLM
jgi:hypothetical protein